MIGLEEQIELFKLIGKELRDNIECIAIGGSAMLFLGLKNSTKDIDLVFLSENDMKKFIIILEKIGFEKEGGKNPVLMKRKDVRFDLFLKEIICFKISSGILKRIREKHEFDNLIVDVISPEDIILLKCATDRVGDRVDAAELVKYFSINWDIIIEESIWQMKNGKKIFPIFLFDFLVELEDLGVSVPKKVLRKLRKISEDEMIKALSKKRKL